MNVFLLIVAIVVAIGVLAYYRASLTMFTAAIAGLLIVGSLTDTIGTFAWLLFLIVALPLNIASVRQQYITKPVLGLYRKIMPEMSTTEKEAIDAGTTWWEADLFRGNPDWHKMHNFPKPRLSAEEQAFMDGPVEELLAMVDDWHSTHERADLSPEVYDFLKSQGFFAMIIAKKFGGLEFSAYAQSCVLQKLTSKSMMLSSIVGVPNSLGPGELLQHYGTDEQKNYYLPRLAKGLDVPCFALTSPEAGSDAGAIPDFGIVCKGQWQGQEVLGMRLTWNKRYITLAPIATVLGLAFKLYDPEKLLGDKEELGITCALIPANTPGVKIGRRHFPLNVPFQNGPTQGDDIFVPLDYIIGGAPMVGQGWKMLVECLSVGRAITLPSNSTGGIKAAAMATGAYARIRRQFKLPIGKMEGVEEAIARIGGYAYMADASTTMSVGAIDLGEKPSVISAITKYHMTERMRTAINDAMDVHGGKGICMGPNNYLARGYQGAPVAITVEGANILTRNMIIYGQGAIRCHPYVLAELQAAQMDDEGAAVTAFDKAVFGHIGFAISNFFRTFWLSLTGGMFSHAPYNDATAKYYKQMNRFSAAMALMSDVAMATLGGDLKRRERISARLGDILSMLYLTSAVLKRFNDEGRQVQDLPLVQWACEDNLAKAQLALDELFDNFPNRAVGVVLKRVVFPWGRTLRKASDKVEHQVARIMQTPCEARSRLGLHLYLTDEPGNQLGRIEQVLLDILAAEPLFDKVSKAANKRLPFYRLHEVADLGLELGVISQEEAAKLRLAEEGRLFVINVDDFEPDYLAADNSLTQQPNGAEALNEQQSKKTKAA
ncbi:MULTISPECIES: acyl-CoA dehydrogenase FadE [unclassified Arsukibacterium]|uniref:acyl-CoA dehydrogenase FadE n=1 Tax=unclassified Arsukibacterium TaxID=2635278 RepID=UPI000C669DA0|nr:MULTISPECIES: acyl-CoA dehydrogenase FadE [unclassified Arsukibacterium]MAA94240.1 acyl-CoA dehydrogenase [Rheinheimera sp.]MBM35110.1 acyl-CoA dehydrogenase [Rheinheimera sp.]|tara:strand:- start:37441 stop:39930 length:2490 start_codon:yes stop_codon:yes gene_type:complete